MDNRITDFSFFKQNSFGDNALYKELVNIFMRTTLEMVGQLLEAKAKNDYDQLAKVAHKLKSNVQSAGLGELHVILDKLENMTWSSINEHQLHQLIATVEQKCNIAVAEAEAELKRLG